MAASPGRTFRDMLSKGPVACMGAHDAVTARLAETVGARAVYVSGYAASAVVTGYPDLGLISQTEMADHIRRICRSTSLPVIADADTGYGGILSAERTVAQWEFAGAAGLHIEDQIFPKRCGHIAGKAVIPTDEMVQKLKAVLAARSSPDFFVIARSDALAVTGLQDTIARCRAYAEAGADALFVDAPESVEQLKTIATGLKGAGKPLLFNSARTGKSPYLSEKQLHELGFDIVIYPIEALLAAHFAVKQAMRSILETGSSNAVADRLTTFAEFNDFVRLAEYVKREGSYGTPA